MPSPKPNHTPSPDLYDSTPLQYCTRLESLDDLYYLGTPNIAASAQFCIRGIEGHRLIVKNNEEIPTEFLFSGIFEINCRDFYILPDGNFDPTGPFNKKNLKVKATCCLLPMWCEEYFNFSAQDFPTAIKNIRAIKKLAPLPKACDVHSMLVKTEDSSYVIKLSHALFKVSTISSLPPLHNA